MYTVDSTDHPGETGSDGEKLQNTGHPEEPSGEIA